MMELKDIDIGILCKLSSQQVDLVTCMQCCKFFKVPKTSACGHTLCSSCWLGRRNCPTCAKQIDNLRHNQPMQALSDHVSDYTKKFKNLFNINLDEFLLDSSEVVSVYDPSKNVKEWLASSQNHFSAPPQSSDQSSQEVQPNPLEVSSNKIQIHTNTRRTTSPEKIVHAPVPQDDWDRIEVMEDATDNNKNKENVIGPMDIEPFDFDDDYTANNPRRSLRNKDMNKNDRKPKEQCSIDKQSSKDSSGEIDKKSNKTKQSWNNVKKMRKEFSKLGKKNKNKLNVSIEMCKKTQNVGNPNTKLPPASSVNYDIDENTPDILNNTEKQQVLNRKEYQNVLLEKRHNDPNLDPYSINVRKETHEQDIAGPVPNPAYNVVDNYFNSKDIECNSTIKPTRVPFYNRGALCLQNSPNKCDSTTVKTINHNICTDTHTSDDIEITIKIGNTITSINIKNKNVIGVKVNADREIQTSLGPHELINKLHTPPSSVKSNKHAVNAKNFQSNNIKSQALNINIASVKASSEKTKKNTDSADTATAQFEITESVEKELSKVMEHVEIEEQNLTKTNANIANEMKQKQELNKAASDKDNLDYLDDLDIFESESVKEQNVQTLKNTEHAPSEILVSTVHTKNRTQKHNRENHNDEDLLPKAKKAKLAENKNKEINNTAKIENKDENPTDSEPLNYDSIIGKVFASIDADMEENPQSQIKVVNNTNTLKDNNNGNVSDNKSNKTPTECLASLNDYCQQKDSENVFSICVEKDEQNIKAQSIEKVLTTAANVEDLLTPVMRRKLEATEDVMVADNDNDMDDSDKSVVEETPQKTTSFSKAKQKSVGTTIKGTFQSQRTQVTDGNVLSEKNVNDLNTTQSVVELTDTSGELKSNKDATVVETNSKKQSTVDTPQNINRFVDQLKHKSTPVARKSLNFVEDNIEGDPEQTLCPTMNDVVAKTTQEKEILSKVFEKTPTLAIKPVTRNLGHRNKRICVAGSCLTSTELDKLKRLCSRNKWTYCDKYCPDLTHLVVSVDDENRSQRSVKYMCALASSKWIVSYEWVEKCLQSKEIINEEYYEALDSTGEPGPSRSRLATDKLFRGITFYCMEPFSVLSVDTLKYMLEAAGGKVVNEAKEVKVTEKTTTPLILLAETENTQEDKYIYLAMQMSVVPVNYEWVLNCLGSYTLISIHDLLLCPSSLLHKVTEKWPQELMARDEDSQ